MAVESFTLPPLMKEEIEVIQKQVFIQALANS